MKKDWGVLVLKCSHCKIVQHISLMSLYTEWAGLIKKEEQEKPAAATQKFTATITCTCGNTALHKGPMFTYIFQLIFDEISSEKSKSRRS